MALSEQSIAMQTEILSTYSSVDTLDMPEEITNRGIGFKNLYAQYLRERLQADIDSELLAAGNALVTRTDIYDFPLEVPDGKLIPVEKS